MAVAPQFPKLHAWLEPPQMDTGSPRPAIHSDEHRLLCAYYVSARVMPEGTVAVLRFEGVLQFRLGYPNDEALRGHPLAKHGMEQYHAYLVENSPLIAEIENQNRVHPAFREYMTSSAIGLLLSMTRPWNQAQAEPERILVKHAEIFAGQSDILCIGSQC